MEPRSAGKKGFGLFANEPIQLYVCSHFLRLNCPLRVLFRGGFVYEYVGEVLNKAKFEKRTRRYARDAAHKHHYFMALKSGQVIDATERGSVSRFINHSCDPNAETQKASGRAGGQGGA